MKKHNYLNNKDILKEIHKSKTTYCSFTEPSYSDYDIIIDSLDEITPELINQGRTLRNERLAKELQDAELEAGNKRKLEEFLVPIEEIHPSDVIFRVMLWEHIPTIDNKTKKPDIKDDIDEELFESEFDEPVAPPEKSPVKYVKVNFPPFQHYKIEFLEDLDLTFNTPQNLPTYKLKCIGKSHWKGTFDDGEFSTTHGQMTNKLAHMFIKLCERYATRSNWRGYTYNDEMRSQALLQLSCIGLKFNEAKSQNPFAYYTAAITNSFMRVLNTEKLNQKIRDDILEMNDFTPSYTRQNESSWGGEDF